MPKISSMFSAPVKVKTSSLENTEITGSTEKVGCHTEDQEEKYISRAYRFLSIFIILNVELRTVLGSLGHSLRGMRSIKQIEENKN